MFLIADGGKTKGHWFLGESLTEGEYFHTTGFSPSSYTTEDISILLTQELLPHCVGKNIDTIHYYGAGCGPQEPRVVDWFQQKFSEAIIIVDNDIVGAGMAGLGEKKGIVGILGTGSNCALYDDGDILHCIGGHGSLLCDEGSGTYLGKSLLRAYMYDRLPIDIVTLLKEKFGSKQQLRRAIYAEQYPHKIFAPLTYIITDYRGVPEIEQILYNGFRDYFLYNIEPYIEKELLPVAIIGSVGNLFQDVVIDVAKTFGIVDISFVDRPLESMVKYIV